MILKRLKINDRKQPICIINYLKMIFLFLFQNLMKIFLWYIIIFSQKFSKLLFSPVGKGTSVMLIFFRSWPCYNIPTIFRSLRLFLANQTISVLNIIHMWFQIRSRYFWHKMLSEILFIILRIHPTSFQKEPKLPSSFVF
jgi:hypothetical protein